MVGPGRAAGAHVGVQRVGDVLCCPYQRVDTGCGERIADGADVDAVEAVGRSDEGRGEALGGQWSRCGPPGRAHCTGFESLS